MPRISVRFSEEEMEEINTYLKNHPEYTKSSLVREAISNYIDRKKYGSVPDDLKETFEYMKQLVEFRYFRDMTDEILYILRSCLDDGTLEKILKNRVKEVLKDIDE